MSARLSRRVGAASYYPPLVDLPATEKLTLARLTEDRGMEFEDLPGDSQRLILEAETNMRRDEPVAAARERRVARAAIAQA